MSRPSRFTEEQKQTIRKLAEHVPVKTIATVLGISASYCLKIVNQKSNNLPNLPPEQDKRRKLMPIDIALMHQFHQYGASQRSIAEFFGVSPCTVRYHLLSDEERKEVNKRRSKYGTYLSKEYMRQQAKDIYYRKKKLLEEQK